MTRVKQQCVNSGFSLVELLAVIGIIAILVGLLMPALVRVRASAKQLQCQVNLRSVYNAAQFHMNDHNGYLPVGGWHWDPPGGIVNPHGLGDDNATRYTYYNDAGVKRPVPVTVALAISLGVKMRLDSRQALEEDMARPDIRKYFKCPSQEEDLRGLTQKSSEPWEAPRDWSSYVFNEAIIGLHERAVMANSIMGKAVRVKRPSIVMFAMDGRPRDRNPVGDNWLMVFDKGPEYTLWDFNLRIQDPTFTYGQELFDYLRHRYRTNIVFMDGHVESIPMTRQGLDSVGISKGIHD